MPKRNKSNKRKKPARKTEKKSADNSQKEDSSTSPKVMEIKEKLEKVRVSEHRNITPTSSEDLLLVTKKEKHIIRTSSSRGFLSKFAIEEVKVPVADNKTRPVLRKRSRTPPQIKNEEKNLTELGTISGPSTSRLITKYVPAEEALLQSRDEPKVAFSSFSEEKINILRNKYRSLDHLMESNDYFSDEEMGGLIDEFEKIPKRRCRNVVRCSPKTLLAKISEKKLLEAPKIPDPQHQFADDVLEVFFKEIVDKSECSYNPILSSSPKAPTLTSEIHDVFQDEKLAISFKNEEVKQEFSSQPLFPFNFKESSPIIPRILDYEELAKPGCSHEPMSTSSSQKSSPLIPKILDYEDLAKAGCSREPMLPFSPKDSPPLIPKILDYEDLAKPGCSRNFMLPSTSKEPLLMIPENKFYYDITNHEPTKKINPIHYHVPGDYLTDEDFEALFNDEAKPGCSKEPLLPYISNTLSSVPILQQLYKPAIPGCSREEILPYSSTEKYKIQTDPGNYLNDEDFEAIFQDNKQTSGFNPEIFLPKALLREPSAMKPVPKLQSYPTSSDYLPVEKFEEFNKEEEGGESVRPLLTAIPDVEISDTPWDAEAKFKELESIFGLQITAGDRRVELDTIKHIWINQLPENVQKKLWMFYINSNKKQ